MLDSLQQHLERIYEVETECPVSDYLITDPALAQHYDTNRYARHTPEKLLVQQSGDTLNIALYLEEALVDHLQGDDPIESLHDGNLTEFCTAVEGVSHFIYLVWNARHGRGISLFELELQAEVDKFIAALFLMGRQRGRRAPRGLLKRLFDAPAYDDALDRDELRRYTRANDYAHRYCRGLQSEFLERRSNRSMLNELRRFYRLTHRYKLNHIKKLN
jgi:hypothetical protein